MSQHTDDLDDDLDDDQPQKPGVRQRMKALETENETLRARAAKADELERQDLFREAGVKINTPLGKLAAQHYNGDLTLEAVKAFALESELISAPPPTTSKEEQDGHTRMLSASTASEPPQHQWTDADLQRAYKAKQHEAIIAAQEAGLLDDVLGLSS